MVKTVLGWHAIQMSFAPTGRRAGWSFSLDGEPPKDDGVWIASDNPSASWTVEMSERSHLSLPTGKSLREVPGQVSIAIGDACPQGKTD